MAPSTLKTSTALAGDFPLAFLHSPLDCVLLMGRGQALLITSSPTQGDHSTQEYWLKKWEGETKELVRAYDIWLLPPKSSALVVEC